MRRTWRLALAGWAPPFLIAAATAAMVVRSWLRWPDVLVDYGQQLYVAWQLGEGQVLYRDIAYFHGPLSSYLHAGVMRLWGTSLLALVFFNLLVAAALIALLYRILTELASRSAAAAACLVFVTVFAFGQYLGIGNYNYVCPYTSEITHGVVLALVAVYCLMRHVRCRTTGPLVFSGLALGLVFLTKVEVFAAAALALGLGLLSAAWSERQSVKRATARLAVLAGAAGAGPAAAFGLFCLALPPPEALGAVTAPYSALFHEGTSELLFYRSRMGLDAPLVNLTRLMTTTVWHFVVLLPAAFAAFLGQKTFLARKTMRLKPMWLAFAYVPIPFLAWNVGSAAWLQAARPLPLLMTLLILACLAALAGRRRGRETAFRDSTVGVLTLAVFALALLVKIVLNSRVYHYGFVLAMPATLLLVLAWLEWIPAWLERRGADGSVFRRVAAAILTVAVAAHLLASDRRLRQKTHLVSSGADAFWSDPRGQAVDAVLEYFAALEDDEPTLVVVPDGIMLNYLARAPSTVPYLNYVPTEVFAFGERRILRQLEDSPPDYVVIVDKSTAEFGYRTFGRDYAREILLWIEGAYETVGLVGAEPLSGQGFGVKLMKRRQDGS